jgi:hypothetical protein
MAGNTNGWVGARRPRASHHVEPKTARGNRVRCDTGQDASRKGQPESRVGGNVRSPTEAWCLRTGPECWGRAISVAATRHVSSEWPFGLGCRFAAGRPAGVRTGQGRKSHGTDHCCEVDSALCRKNTK